MSTNDVPGHDDRNADELAMGCWAEHDDGSLIFVESTEGNRAIFCVFDVSKDPVVQYRDAMPIKGFKEQFTWDGSPKKGKSKDKWTWHDKSPFPWERVIKAGVTAGAGYASADDQLTAAERVRDSLKMRGRALTEDDVDEIKSTKIRRTIRKVVDRLGQALKDLDTGL